MTLKLYGSGSIENVDSIVTSASANISGTELGYIDGVTSAIQTQLNNAGKILQIVRATDSTDRSTTSATLTDANISVTITPTKSTSAVIIIWAANCGGEIPTGIVAQAIFAITDSSNNVIGGEKWLSIRASSSNNEITAYQTMIAYSTPATTSAVTYKGRFRRNNGQSTFLNNSTYGEGQMYAIEVSA